MMIDFLRALIENPGGRAAHGPDTGCAVAALLVEAARSDADYDGSERTVIERFLADMFGLDAAAARAMRAAGEAAQADAADLVRFTRVVKTELPPGARIRFIEALWSVVFSDGARDPYEDALLRKLAPLIAVSDRESAEARQRVMARLGLD